MALPTGKHATLLSIRAKANKALLLAADLDDALLGSLAGKLFAATDERLSKLPKAKKTADIVEEDIATE